MEDHDQQSITGRNNVCLPKRMLIIHVNMTLTLGSDTFLSGFVLLLVVINVPLRAQIVNLYGPVKAGVLLLPMMAGGAVGCALGGAATLRRNNTFPVLIFASILIIIGSALLVNLPNSYTPADKQWGFEALLGVGVGLKISSTTFIAILQSDFEDHGTYMDATISFLAHPRAHINSNFPRHRRPVSRFWWKHWRGHQHHRPHLQDPVQPRGHIDPRRAGSLLPLAPCHILVLTRPARPRTRGFYRRVQH